MIEMCHNPMKSLNFSISHIDIDYIDRQIGFAESIILRELVAKSHNNEKKLS